jgi:hypothetical protein
LYGCFNACIFVGLVLLKHPAVAEPRAAIDSLPGLEHGELPVKRNRQNDSLASLVVVTGGQKIALRYPIGAQEVRGFVWAAERRRNAGEGYP